MKVQKQIAKAIRRADKSYFFENYDRQAGSVIKALEKAGYAIMPIEPDKDVLREVADTISTGRMKPEDHIKNVYQTLLGLMKKQY